MNDIGKNIKEARQKLNLSVKDLSDKTKVRQFVIESIEKGDYSIMPDVYIRSFIKTLTSYLKIDYTGLPESEKKAKIQTSKSFDDEKITSSTQVKPDSSESSKLNKFDFMKREDKVDEHYSSIFKKKKISTDKRYIYINYTIYIILFLAIASAIYFALSSINKSPSKLDNSEVITDTDTVSLDSEENSLFSYFEKPDSLRLRAKASDTVWIRVLSDGKTVNESLLRPGMEESWAAEEFFIVDLGNVGGADLYRNDEKLPLFGRAGTVVKNVKITKTEVLNIYSQKTDSLRSSRRRIKSKKENKEPKMIEASPIQTSPVINMKKRDSSRF
ncbi:MAG: helix-turn-helix domain-containing protein [Candidatus Kapaibacterium sp.]